MPKPVDATREWVLQQSFRGTATAIVEATTAAEAVRIANAEGADLDLLGMESVPSSRWRVVKRGAK